MQDEKSSEDPLYNCMLIAIQQGSLKNFIKRADLMFFTTVKKVVARLVCHPSTWETEAGRLLVQIQLGNIESYSHPELDCNTLSQKKQSA
jgi:hypothetical protein